MRKRYYTIYHPKIVRSLVYMLQASEYHVREYLQWFWRQEDFLQVERRNQLRKTPKAKLLLVGGWIITLLVLGLAVLSFTLGIVSGYIIGLLLLLGWPYILAYGLIAPLVIIKVILQRPIEHRRLQDTRQQLSTHPAIKIAVAGSFGKTSMREILKTVIGAGKRTAAPPSSYNTPLGIAKFAGELTGQEEVLVFELGEYYPGDVAQLCELIDPDIGVITGVNEAHFEKFRSLTATQKTIFELADHLKDKPVYVNAESDLASAGAGAEHIRYSRSGVADMHVSNARTDLSGTRFMLSDGRSKYELHSKLLGLHQVGPLCAAVAIAKELGLTKGEIETGVAATEPFKHRLQPVPSDGEVVTIDDSYNGNPAGVRAVIEFLAGLSNRRRFYVTPGLVELGTKTEVIHEEIGIWLAEAGIEKVVLIENSVTPYIAAGLEKANFAGEVLWYNDGPTAFAALSNLTVAGDVVVIQNDWPDQYA